jgi:hypothetical protein
MKTLLLFLTLTVAFAHNIEFDNFKLEDFTVAYPSRFVFSDLIGNGSLTLQNASVIYNLEISVHNHDTNSTLFIIECQNKIFDDILDLL